MKKLLSIIIVKYRSEKYLPQCLASIKRKKEWEVIVVDNDKENIGYGPACNKGALQAKGRYLLFLNPDTLVIGRTLEEMVAYLEKHPEVGVIGPQLLTGKREVVPSSSAIPNPLMALFTFSFLEKIWPNNPWSKKCWYRDWERNSLKEVGAVSGAALMIRKDLFKKLGGFDEKFFLFFEEVDLCKRAEETGKKVVFFPKAKIVHYGGKSTPKTSQIKKIFKKSRFYFFRKHYCFFSALFLEIFLRIFER